MGQNISVTKSSMGKSSLKLDKDFLGQFSKSEVKYLKAAYKDLAQRSPGPTIDRKTFLRHFNLPGLHGEQLFKIFDPKHSGKIDFNEFMTGLALCLKGSLEEKLEVIFKIYDISEDQCVSKTELETMLHHIPFQALHLLLTASLQQSATGINVNNLSVASSVNSTSNDSDSQNSLNSISGESKQTTTERKEMIDRLVKDAFLHYDSDQDGRLSKKEFLKWVETTPEVVSFLDSVFTFMCTKTVPTVPSYHSISDLTNGNLAQLGTAEGSWQSKLKKNSLQLEKIQQIENQNTRQSSVGSTFSLASFASAFRPSHRTPSVIKTNSINSEDFASDYGSKRAHVNLINVNKSNSGKAASNIQLAGGQGSSYDNESVASRQSFSQKLWGKLKERTRHSNSNREERAIKHGKNRSRSHSPTFFSQVYLTDGHVNTVKSSSSLAKFGRFLNSGGNDDQSLTLGIERKEPFELFFNPDTNIERTKSMRSLLNASPLSFYHNRQVDDNSDILLPTPEANQKSSSVFKEGNLMKVGKRYSLLHSRHYVLRGNILCYFHSENDKIPKGVVFLNGSYVEECPDNETSVEFHKMKKLYGFQIDFNFDDSIKNYPGQQADEITGETKELRKIYYTKYKHERDEWVRLLRLASKHRKFEDNYEMSEQIGSGKFAIVYKCLHKKTKKFYAVKVLTKKDMSLREKDLLRSEIAILRLVSHPNVVKLTDIFESLEVIYIVTELVKGGELFDFIVGRPRFDEIEAYILLKQLVNAVDYLHSAGIMHRDIKPENILLENVNPGRKLGTNTVIKLTDFGLSKMVFPNQKMKLPCGTVSYVAPEVLRQSGYTVAADIWSIGVILFLVLRGKLPFDADESEDIKTLIISLTPKKQEELFNDSVWQKLDPDLVGLIKKLLSVDPQARITCDKILNNSWVLKMKDKYPLDVDKSDRGDSKNKSSDLPPDKSNCESKDVAVP